MCGDDGSTVCGGECDDRISDCVHVRCNKLTYKAVILRTINSTKTSLLDTLLHVCIQVEYVIVPLKHLVPLSYPAIH